MPEVKVYSQLIRGSEHVHSGTRDDGACILFVPHMEVDGHRIRTEDPEYVAWKAAGMNLSTQPERGFEDAQPKLGMGEGFVTLTIQHADDETWKFLSSLPEDSYGEGSTRESFDVIVTHLEYIPLEPEDGRPWISGDPRPPVSLADLERATA
jgi:hypothetical protein